MTSAVRRSTFHDGRTLRPHDPEFSELKMMFERDSGAALPVVSRD
jgi:hypothetical protein